VPCICDLVIDRTVPAASFFFFALPSPLLFDFLYCNRQLRRADFYLVTNQPTNKQTTKMRILSTQLLYSSTRWNLSCSSHLPYFLAYFAGWNNNPYVHFIHRSLPVNRHLKNAFINQLTTRKLQKTIEQKTNSSCIGQSAICPRQNCVCLVLLYYTAVLRMRESRCCCWTYESRDRHLSDEQQQRRRPCAHTHTHTHFK
jgi:hypothetical protein